MHCRKWNAFWHSAETNAQLEKLDAEGRVAWALENLPGNYVLSSSFGIQAAVSLHLVNQIRPDIPVILTDTGYLFRKPISLLTS
ncbi:phosphoadenosine phosphosulfate reductase [Klebsiella pneumoniae]|nr:phosphoadenosine phosphosulfate reductase [Klebsiella pneumoniae]